MTDTNSNTVFIPKEEKPTKLRKDISIYDRDCTTAKIKARTNNLSEAIAWCIENAPERSADAAA